MLAAHLVISMCVCKSVCMYAGFINHTTDCFSLFRSTVMVMMMMVSVMIHWMRVIVRDVGSRRWSVNCHRSISVHWLMVGRCSYHRCMVTYKWCRTVILINVHISRTWRSCPWFIGWNLRSKSICICDVVYFTVNSIRPRETIRSFFSSVRVTCRAKCKRFNLCVSVRKFS